MVLDASLLNTQLYKVRFKGKSNPAKEGRPPLNLGVVAIEKGALVSPSTTVGQITYIILSITNTNTNNFQTDRFEPFIKP